MNATSLARVKALLDISNTDQDAVLTTMIEAVSKRIETYLDRPLLRTARTEEYAMMPRQDVLFLRSYPLANQAAITSIKVALDWDFASVSAISSNDYHVDLETGAVSFLFFPVKSWNGRPDRPAPNVVQVTYTAGFATDTTTLISEFPDIAYAADTQVIAMWRRRDSPQGASYGLAGSSTSYEGPLNLVPDVIEALTPYRRLRFAANG